jgi:hypothetical protein
MMHSGLLPGRAIVGILLSMIIFGCAKTPTVEPATAEGPPGARVPEKCTPWLVSGACTFYWSVDRFEERLYGRLLFLARENLDGPNSATISPAPTIEELASHVRLQGSYAEPSASDLKLVDSMLGVLEFKGIVRIEPNKMIITDIEALSILLRHL